MRRKNNNFIHIIFAIILVSIFTALGYEFNTKIDEKSNVKVSSNQENVVSNTVQENNTNLKIHFVDQTTPNMIQGLKGIFARKPLISIGI